MKRILQPGILLAIALLLNAPVTAQESSSFTKPKTEKKMQQVLIDKLTVQQSAKKEFMERMNINRNIIKQQPGFIKDEVYERLDENGNLVVITIAVWENADLIKKAKEAVEAEYKRTDFNTVEFCQKLNIKIERGIYEPMTR